MNLDQKSFWTGLLIYPSLRFPFRLLTAFNLHEKKKLSQTNYCKPWLQTYCDWEIFSRLGM